MKIVFFGTSNVALPVLEHLKQQHEILAVVTQPDAVVGRKKEVKESPISVLANEMQLRIFKPEKVKGDLELITSLEQLNADIFVVVSYGKILPLEIINLPKLKTVNVHFSALPKYRGASPVQEAIKNGDQQTGISIFLLDEKMDTGPVLSVSIYNIDPDDTFFSLSQKLAFSAASQINEVLKNYENGQITPLPQDDTAASYCGVISKLDGKIDWSKNAIEIYNTFRAYFPWPGLWTTWNEKKLKIIDCIPVAEVDLDSVPGLVKSDGIVTCGNGTQLKIKSLQLEGKNELQIINFLNGCPQFIGSKLL